MSSLEYLATLGYISSIAVVDKEDIKNFIHSAEYQSMGNLEKNKVLGKKWQVLYRLVYTQKLVFGYI